jgi:hypothetical protein
MWCFVNDLEIRPNCFRSTLSEPAIYEARAISVKLSGRK